MSTCLIPYPGNTGGRVTRTNFLIPLGTNTHACWAAFMVWGDGEDAASRESLRDMSLSSQGETESRGLAPLESPLYAAFPSTVEELCIID